MGLLPFANSDATPNESAAFVNAVLIAGLYHQDQAPFSQYASFVQGTVGAFASDPDTFEPDYGVITAGGEALVVFGGTTNNAQTVQHCASSFFPAQDSAVPLALSGRPFAVGSFLMGTKIVEPIIEAAISSIGTGIVRISGHSYGAAASLIFGRHLSNAVARPTRVELITFGEPMSYDGRPAVSEPDFHARFVAVPEGQIQFEQNMHVDPVSIMPTGSLEIFQLAKVVKFARGLFALSWAPYGDCYKINSTASKFVEPLPFGLAVIPYRGAADIVFNAQYLPLHYMDPSYLPKVTALWQRSGKNPELSFLLPFVSKYTGQPFQPSTVLGPSVSADVLNQAFFPSGETPITQADRANWEVISAVGGFFPVSGGTQTMTLMRGSLLCGIMGGGFSETLHSSNTSDTYVSMQTRLAAIMPARMKLSNGVNDPPPKAPNNQMSVVAFRISDDLKNRDVLAVPVNTPVGWNGTDGNLEGQRAVKVVWRDLSFQQIAVSYLHGVPIGGTTATLSGNETRTTPMTGTYNNLLQAYCNVIAAQGLGFNTINNNPPNSFGPITAVVYNATSGYYTITVTNAVPQGKFRVSLRSFKSLRVLNGRQSAQSTGANSFVVFKQAANHTWDNSGTATPLNGYNLGVPFSNYIVVIPSTASASLICDKKLGRPFFLQRGRVTRRAA